MTIEDRTDIGSRRRHVILEATASDYSEVADYLHRNYKGQDDLCEVVLNEMVKEGLFDTMERDVYRVKKKNLYQSIRIWVKGYLDVASLRTYENR